MNNTSRMVVVLLLVGAISGLVLALTFKWTEPMINEIAQSNQKKAILEVLPKAKSYKTMENNNQLFIGYDDNGNEVGLAFIAEGGGFQGDIRMMVGMDTTEEKLTGMTVLSHLETPGLGARIEEDWFKDQFNEKSIEDDFIAKQDVEAITGATISSNAVSNILKNSIPKALDAYRTRGGK
ncbi:RnfABCDGE type electron transport complex subunit G [Sporosalibacterium faouarense]|uniref:RnfABCDGE type electron transport complex subunit G n=1 Tax=Sporosalibacterium faouarense TaxID=516123 RepID=UPI00192ACEB3|nr:RnfABCDGE type electron transport complex subunit G [Sporosalibacterium faouarense]